MVEFLISKCAFKRLRISGYLWAISPQAISMDYSIHSEEVNCRATLQHIGATRHREREREWGTGNVERVAVKCGATPSPV